MSPHVHLRSLPPEVAECRCVSQQCGLQDYASFEAARQEAPHAA